MEKSEGKAKERVQIGYPPSGHKMVLKNIILVLFPLREPKTTAQMIAQINLSLEKNSLPLQTSSGNKKLHQMVERIISFYKKEGKIRNTGAVATPRANGVAYSFVLEKICEQIKTPK